MSIQFIAPSIVIKRLKTARTYASKTNQDFQIWGAGEFEKARQSSFFAKDSDGDRVAVLIVAVGNNTGSLIHQQGLAESNVTHSIDVHYIAPLFDRRGQYQDELSVWFKQFLLQSLHAFNPSSGANQLVYSGDNLVSINGVAGYARTFTFSQEMIIDGSDVWGGDENSISGFGDLDEFLQIFDDIYTESPPFGEVSDVSELDITIRES